LIENKNIKLKPRLERKRHIAKAITWRIVGSIDTYLLAWFVIGIVGDWNAFGITLSEEIVEKKEKIALLLTALEVFTKSIFYYFHERIWYKLNFIASRQRVRHIIKTISWRLVGAIDTIILVFLVFYLEDRSTKGAAEVALTIFSFEIITKMILYYIHERVWFSSNYGVIKPKDQ
jgi:uncharacterized membrane protein